MHGKNGLIIRSPFYKLFLFVIMSNQRDPLAGCHFIYTHADGFNRNLSLNDKRPESGLISGREVLSDGNKG
jgi:hypothetical protein